MINKNYWVEIDFKDTLNDEQTIFWNDFLKKSNIHYDKQDHKYYSSDKQPKDALLFWISWFGGPRKDIAKLMSKVIVHYDKQNDDLLKHWIDHHKI